MATDSAYGPGELVERLPVTSGAVAGVVTHFAGLVATYVLLVADPEFEFGVSRAQGVGTVDEVGWLFFSAHFARIERRASFGDVGGAGTERLNLVAETATGLPDPVFYAVPVALLIAGGVVVSMRELWESSTKAHALAGATVAVGYFPLAAIGVLLFETQVGVGDAAFTQSPELSSTLLLVGLAYPLCFGGLGGLLAARLRG